MTTGSSWRNQIRWTTRLLIAVQGLLTDAARRSDLIRRLLLLLEPKSPPSSTNGVTSSDVTVNPSRNLWFRLYLPSTPSFSTLPLIFYFHGGGFVAFAPNSIIYDQFCRTLARDLQSVVVSVNYRLAPDHRCPCQYEDGLEISKFIDAGNYSILPSSTDLNRCFIAGDSAGGKCSPPRDGQIRRPRV